MNKKLLVGLLSVLLIGLVVYGCGQVVKEDEVTGSGTLMGKVYTIDGLPLGGVTVTVTGVTTPAATNDGGYFSFLTVPAVNRATVNFTRTGYVSTAKITSIKPGIITSVEKNVDAQSAPTALDAGSGGTAEDPDNLSAKVIIDGGTLRDASGNVVTGAVDVYVTSFDPLVSGQMGAFPGNSAGLVDGQEQPFVSRGFMDVEVANNTLVILCTKLSAKIGIVISSQALDQRLNERCVEFLKKIFWI